MRTFAEMQWNPQLENRELLKIGSVRVRDIGYVRSKPQVPAKPD
ncbi:hypothetical protein SBA3_500021 [Candidatus Sulfopaludibacter sp. SbA3]|nr:hypothetical protein SBA3_500021 [Candidatus Sulfopaludibacter sp. SbA3]